VQTVEVECALQLDPDVAAVLACGHRVIRADIVEGRTNGPLRARSRFDLQRCLDDESARTVKQSIELLCGGGDLYVLWADVDDEATDPPGYGWGSVIHTLTAAQGARRRSVLPIDAGHAVRGRVQWADGSPREGQTVRFDEPTCSRSLQTDDHGGFCYLVDTGVHGRLLLEQRGHDGPQQVQDAGSGSVHTFCTGELPWRLRLVDPRGAPIERFRVCIGPEFRVHGDGTVQADDFDAFAAGPHLPLHPDGVVSLPRERLLVLPRLGINVGDGRAHVLAVTARWLAAGGVEQDVRMRDCLPEAALVIAGAGTVLHGLPAGAELRLRERCAQTTGGIEFTVHCQERLPWRIEHLLAGTYDLEIHVGEKCIARGTVVLPPAGSAEFVLPK
jgi:hypothetical protein